MRLSKRLAAVVVTIIAVIAISVTGYLSFSDSGHTAPATTTDDYKIYMDLSIHGDSDVRPTRAPRRNDS